MNSREVYQQDDREKNTVLENTKRYCKNYCKQPEL